MSGAASFFTPPNVRRGVTWLRAIGAESDVVVSSRVRLARNISGFPFLTKATRPQRQEIVTVARDRLLSAGIAPQMLWVDVHSAPPLDRTLMVERHLISKEHARGVIPGCKSEQVQRNEIKNAPESSSEPRGVAISIPDETVSVMVNEEDHLRIQVLLSGLELTAAFERVNAVDDAIETPEPAKPDRPGRIRYSYSSRFGYLTACPTNVGTGIRVSVMLHLPALKVTGEMDKVKRATKDMALAVRGYYGEGSEAAGEFYQISNQTTLGKSEQTILNELEREIIPRIVQYERAARKLLFEKRRRSLEDKVFRAVGTLRHARMLTPEEALNLLSDVRLGIVSGLVKDITPEQVNQLILLTQPAHLQRVLGKEMDQGARREARADLVRQALVGGSAAADPTHTAGENG